MNYKIAPLPGSFMIFSLLGIIFSVNMLMSDVNLVNIPIKSYAFAFLLVFILMFISALISMSKAPLGSYDLKEEK